MTETTLRRLLLIDALTCGTVVLLCLLLRGWLNATLGLPGWLITWAAVICAGAALVMVATASQRRLRRGLVALVIAGNAGWIAASLLLALAGVAGSMAGDLLIVFQALGVLCMTLLEWQGLRHLRPALA